MLCDECGMREAAFTMVIRVGEKSTTRHLCPKCILKRNELMTDSHAKEMLSHLLEALAKPEESQQEASEEVVCPQCGTSYQHFMKTGRLGCASCYASFGELLTPTLMRLHGHVEHTGRRPVRSEASQRRRDRREELSRQMAQAVAAEDFETAAQLRDELRLLSAKEEER